MPKVNEEILADQVLNLEHKFHRLAKNKQHDEALDVLVELLDKLRICLLSYPTNTWFLAQLKFTVQKIPLLKNN